MHQWTYSSRHILLVLFFNWASRYRYGLPVLLSFFSDLPRLVLTGTYLGVPYSLIFITMLNSLNERFCRGEIQNCRCSQTYLKRIHIHYFPFREWTVGSGFGSSDPYLTNGSGSGSCSFNWVLEDGNKTFLLDVGTIRIRPPLTNGSGFRTLRIRVKYCCT